jgi:hypothetical protein
MTKIIVTRKGDNTFKVEIDSATVTKGLKSFINDLRKSGNFTPSTNFVAKKAEFIITTDNNTLEVNERKPRKAFDDYSDSYKRQLALQAAKKAGTWIDGRKSRRENYNDFCDKQLSLR